ncbi:alpha-L-fucosidase [Brachybacterium phenoliresistens]|uniref:alpha-L-fucosidase n=1 Tax=Brachybacterium phenoliresistens TaxID=396014 RepID=Z9JS12_9MICO|nr:alpha-L-fucosidase [Brachybacterium phenoliresistens]EWS80586.1 alpha-L-fucosidase [Brachybacterium phenoliresistens]
MTAETESALLAPTPEQLAWQRAGLGMFFHVGINTFAGKEWSDGTVPASDFAPTDLDAEEWVRTARDLGARYVVLTAKHHDGFCLWPTATTDYSVASSPWKDGSGDVVGDVAAACRKHGLGLGLYLSPWDRHEPCYEDPEAYDAFYLRQLRELCTNYGELFEVWFDGAGSAGRVYDWEAIGALLAELQPQAMVFNMGPATIRWVGNEDGLAADPCEYVTRSTDLNNYDPDVVELGQARYLPPECDVSLRRGWFWQEGEEPKSVEHLLEIHDRSLGLGANLLLNVPPDRRGRIDPVDAARLVELRAALDARFGAPVAADLRAIAAPAGARVEAELPGPTVFDHVELVEDVSTGQRVRAHRVLDSDGTVLAQGGTIGVRRIHRLPAAVEAASLILEVEGEGAVIEAVRVHDATGAPAPALPEDYRAPTDAPID